LRNGALILITWQPLWLEFAYHLENTNTFYLIHGSLSNSFGKTSNNLLSVLDILSCMNYINRKNRKGGNKKQWQY